MLIRSNFGTGALTNLCNTFIIKTNKKLYDNELFFAKYILRKRVQFLYVFYEDFGINHPRNFWKFWNFYNFIIFKNAFGQFMLNRALKHVITSANYKINSKTFLPQIFLPLIRPLIISFLSSFNDGKIKFWWIMKIINFRLYGILPVSKVFTVAVVTMRAVFWP